jgi:lipopolysaccharide export system ATP-binding protein
MDDDSALILDGVFYRVPSLDILQGVHLKARAGAITGLFGRNGSGKTTLLKIAGGQIQPNSGLTILDGNRLHKPLKRTRYAKIAYLPQESMLPADVHVRTIVRSAGLSSSQVPDRLLDGLDQRVRTLSGGERRLLEVAIVLGLERDYVLLDEPFTGVEPILIDAIGTRIERAVAQGTGVLVTDHYHQHVTPLADDAYVLWQKQCDRLDGDASIHDQLVQMGYLSEKDENEKEE